MRTVTPDEVRDNLPELLDEVARGESITIARDGVPVARIERAWDPAGIDTAIAGIRELREEIRQDWEARGLPPVTVEELLAWRDEGRS